jgi:hypothetical protein
VARVYNLREGVPPFLEEENLLHAEHFRHEYFVSQLAYLCYIFDEFNISNRSVQENDTNIIVVTDKVKTFIGKLGF